MGALGFRNGVRLFNTFNVSIEVVIDRQRDGGAGGGTPATSLTLPDASLRDAGPQCDEHVCLAQSRVCRACVFPLTPPLHSSSRPPGGRDIAGCKLVLTVGSEPTLV